VHVGSALKVYRKLIDVLQQQTWVLTPLLLLLPALAPAGNGALRPALMLWLNG
jgi:hypothetical protein